MDRGGLRLTRPGWTPLLLLLLLPAVSVDVRPVLDRDDVNPMVVGVDAVHDTVDATTTDCPYPPGVPSAASVSRSPPTARL